ncbi:MAG TPA: hypothetical protein VJU85_05250 [Nitrososphaeraceae archaeon]|nr:hypothetical protein [Nitrososphaeraceae archaeon]
MHRDYKWICAYLLLSSFFFTSADISLIIDTRGHFLISLLEDQHHLLLLNLNNFTGQF